jgi:hypothetical protein
METWISTNFAPAYGGWVVYTDADFFITVDNTQITTNFGNLTAPPTYADLSALQIAQQGWQKVFDKWKTDGKVS